MRENANEARKQGLRLAVEPRPREIVSGTDSLLMLFDFLRSDEIGAVVDISHMHIEREVPSISIGKLGSKIFGVHLSDNDGITERHWPPGEGQINWHDVLSALKFVRYTGVLGLEVLGMSVENELLEGIKYIRSVQSEV